MKKDNIVLIGFMGSGKTSTGIRLSYRLRRGVEDTDKLIERKEGRAISDIFATDGEEHFRKLETQMLQYLCETRRNQIISVGGGTPVREENRSLLKALGLVVYLRIQPETVCKRLKNDKTRPLLRSEDPESRIRELLHVRKEAYESCADLIIDVDDKNIAQVMDIIELHLQGVSEK